ncbi:enoyl-CoA hydratase/isomerase family protein [Microbacterium aurantiacum]|uniref:Enoyl-CoA hydratase/isomerase family protein n=1 Tax=Microbacterium aurantiacum TaxID=162393 RepID=A0ABT8FVN0_9MICO|nr:enoyl-CoA hydratase/isomerase family protein [Microbacterium aurantiacum]MDN4465364.1 enoyl-CoA hydratase/isomerase family protein [Microbacterium aurantiacum]
MSHEFRTVLFDVADHVATITLNRPERLNAFNEAMVGEIGEIWRIVRDEDDIHTVVIRAAGDRAFCTGVDAQEGPWWQDQAVFRQQDPGAILGAKAQQVWKPVIAAVQGMAAGGAMYFLNEADIVIASEDATFFDPHATAGLVSALEPIGMLQRGIPLGDVLRWALMGNDERITAPTALRLGIVSEVVPRAQLWEHAGALAASIAARRPDAIQGTVRAIWEALDVPPSIARQRGLAYTQLGNGQQAPDVGIPRVKPTFR